jgi:hypothetical protein
VALASRDEGPELLVVFRVGAFPERSHADTTGVSGVRVLLLTTSSSPGSNTPCPSIGPEIDDNTKGPGRI